MYKEFPHKTGKVKTMQNIQEDTTVKDMGKIYVALDDRQAELQSNMIEVEGKIINQSISIILIREQVIVTLTLK